MNQSLSLPVGLAALVFAFTSATEAQARCKDRLLNNSFSCVFRSDAVASPRGETCLEFTDDNDVLDPPKFDLADIGEASIDGVVVYGCTCDPVGTFARARFNRSQKDFSCSGAEFPVFEGEEITLPWAMRGRISSSGERITAHQVNILANSFILRCDRVSSCGDSSLSAQKTLDDNALELQRSIEESSALRAKRRLLESHAE